MKAISVCITALTALLVLLYVLKHKTRPTLYVVSCDNFIVQWCWTNKIRFHLVLNVLATQCNSAIKQLSVAQDYESITG